MTRFSYYPGCSIEGTAIDYGSSITTVFELLGMELLEIPDWVCCGSTPAHSLDERLSVLLPAKNLAEAEKMGLEIVVPCPLCYNRLLNSQEEIIHGKFESPWPIRGDSKIWDPTRLLSQGEYLDRIRERVKKSLDNLKVVCYYGCQMVRPPKLTKYKEYNNPKSIDIIMEALGAQVLDWSYKTTCCGASIHMGRKEVGQALTLKLLKKAHEAGAEAIVVSCQLCQLNLDYVQMETKAYSMPVMYFSEMMLIAFNTYAEKGLLDMHLVDPKPLFLSKGIEVK